MNKFNTLKRLFSELEIKSLLLDSKNIEYEYIEEDSKKLVKKELLTIIKEIKDLEKEIKLVIDANK